MIGLKPRFKVWLETEKGYAFGPGTFNLLKEIERKGSLRLAADSLGMSYRYAWGLVKKVEKGIGAPILETFKGGSHGGGGAALTEEGRWLLREYSRIVEAFSRTSEEYSEQRKGEGSISQRRRLWGQVLSIKSSGEEVEVYVKLDVEGTIALRLKTKVAEELGLAEGDRVVALIEHGDTTPPR